MEIERLKEYRLLNPGGLTEAQLSKIQEELGQPSKGTISDECLDFELWCQGLKSRQELFADYIEEFLRGKNVKRILEVGGGRRGRLSLLLAERGYTMTCMDPKLEIGGDGPVEVIREAFDYRTASLSCYDFVAAQEPCEAAEHIVRACAGQGVPFLAALCGTPHRLISGEMPEDVWSWYDYLEGINSDCTELEVVKLYGAIRVAVIRSRENAGKTLIRH